MLFKHAKFCNHKPEDTCKVRVYHKGVKLIIRETM